MGRPISMHLKPAPPPSALSAPPREKTLRSRSSAWTLLHHAEARRGVGMFRGV